MISHTSCLSAYESSCSFFFLFGVIFFGGGGNEVGLNLTCFVLDLIFGLE